MTNPTPKHGPELLPCPFCGGKAYRDRVDNQSLFWVACLECGIDGRICESAAEADAAWNRRSAIQQAAEPDLTAAYLLGRAACAEKGAGAVPEGVSRSEAESLARRFHEAYERLAPSFNYGTRPDTKVFYPNTDNGQLMIAVCQELLAATPTPPVGGGVPLSDAQILDIAQDFVSQYTHGGTTFDEFDASGFARAIEAAHGINPVAGEGKV